jgi:YD repeat-containing protein
LCVKVACPPLPEIININDYNITRTKRNKLTTLTDGTYTKTTKINRYAELRKIEDNIISVRLKRNLAGQIVKKVEKLQNQRRNIYHYTYDERGRLTEVKERRNVVESYTYDSNGNRQSATVNGTTVTASLYT